MKSKKIFWSLASLTLAISPIAIIASCANSNDNSSGQLNPDFDQLLQKEINQEVARLDGIKSENFLSKLDLDGPTFAKFIQSPEALLQEIKTTLKLNNQNFQYGFANPPHWQKISNKKNQIEEQYQLTFSILVKKQNQSNTTKEKELLIKVTRNQDEGLFPPDFKPDTLPDQLVLNQEKNRINELINSSKATLLIKSFTSDNWTKFIQNKENIFKVWWGFVPQQYFSYKVVDFQETNLNAQNQQPNKQISFKVEAKLWKTKATTKPIIQSDQFSFKFFVGDLPDPDRPQPDQGTYKIEAKSSVEIDLKNNPKINLAWFKDLNSENSGDLAKLIADFLQASPETFYTITGKLPTKWDWYNAILMPEIIINNNAAVTNNSTSATLSWHLLYATDDPNSDEDQVEISINIKNGFYDETKPLPKPSDQEQFNQFKQEFESLIQKQTFDEIKLHSGINNVYQFANLDVNGTGQASAKFTNYLNISEAIENLEKKYKLKFRVSTANESINYLTNEIKWTWMINSDKNQKLNAIFNNQSLTYKPSASFIKEMDLQQISDSRLNLDSNAIKVGANLDQSIFPTKAIPLELQKQLLNKFSSNWTWKARELVAYLRFIFYQTFGDAADQINYGIENIDSQMLNPENLNSKNPQNYTVVLKARFNQDVRVEPWVQNQSSWNPVTINVKKNDVITIKLDAYDVWQNPDVVISANEIFPTSDSGISWGTGFNKNQILVNRPQRTDNYWVLIGKSRMTMKINDQFVVNNLEIVNRFLNLNLINRYDFKDAFFSQPQDPFDPNN